MYNVNLGIFCFYLQINVYEPMRFVLYTFVVEQLPVCLFKTLYFYVIQKYTLH